jgi:hypothetical protein
MYEERSRPGTTSRKRNIIAWRRCSDTGPLNPQYKTVRNSNSIVPRDSIETSLKTGVCVRLPFEFCCAVRDSSECAVLASPHYCGSARMPFSPSIVPSGEDQDVYLLLDQFGGRLGRAWRETDEEDTDFETLIRDLLEGQYSNPVRVVAFNTAEGWSRDVSDDVADELRERCAGGGGDLGF